MVRENAGRTAEFLETGTSSELNRSWRRCLDSCEGATGGQKAVQLAAVTMLRDEYNRTLKIVGDPQEREFITAMFYIHLKSLWTILNVRTGYQIAQETFDYETMCRCSLISVLLDRVENSMEPTLTATITRFMASPAEASVPQIVFRASDISPATEFIDAQANASSKNPPEETIRTLTDRISLLEEELTALQQTNRTLEQHFGTSDPKLIIARFEGSESDNNLINELESALGDIERSMFFASA